MRPALAAALLLLAACVPPRIRVSYPVVETPEDVARAKALSQVYLAFPDEDGEYDLGAFAARMDEVLRARGGGLLAYRACPPGDDPFIAGLSPSAVLSVDLSFGPVRRFDFEREVKSKDKDGVETTKKEPMTRITRRVDARVRLTAADGTVLVDGRSAFAEEGEEKTRDAAGKARDSDWALKHEEALLRSAAVRAGGLLPSARTLTREREIHVDTEDAVSKEASTKAQEGAWEKASELWAARLDEGKGGWRELWNLAVAAEARQAFGEAGRLYGKARDAAGADPAAAAVPFAEASSDTARAAALTARSEAAAAFFSRPVAVLPFADETTSVDGPANLRRMTASALARGGYAVLDLDDVDGALRRHGFSQGGQLAKGRPADFAKWTGAERLVFANITEFRNVMLGFLGRREVAGRLWAWDAGAGAEVYAAERSSVRQEATLDGGEAAGRFMGQLGKSLLENMAGKPLAEESARWVVRCIQGLPLRPPAKR